MNAPTVTAAPVENFTGARLMRITWSAKLTADDGSVSYCPHWKHGTKEAALACGRKIARKREATA